MADSPLTFIRQSIKDFRTTGAVAPSSLFLARGIAKALPVKIDNNYKVVEVGPGTGSVTIEILRRMDGAGQLDLWEISPAFCGVLRKRMLEEPLFRRMGSRLAIHEGDIRNLPPRAGYDAVISGLPFNNFEPREVQEFLEHFRALLKPGGVLIWFEYVAIRHLQSAFVSKGRREQLKDIRDITGNFVRAHQFKQQIIPINFPPARIRQLKFG